METPWITRDARGVHVPRRPAAEIPPHVLRTFEHACLALGHLVKRGERLTCLDWCERIAERFPPHERRERCLAAIKCAMLTEHAGQAPAAHDGAPAPSLDDYARAGFRGDVNPHGAGSAAFAAHAIGVRLAELGEREPRAVHVAGGRVQANGLQFEEHGPGSRFELIG